MANTGLKEKNFSYLSSKKLFSFKINNNIKKMIFHAVSTYIKSRALS